MSIWSACEPCISLKGLNFGSRWYHVNVEVENNKILSILYRSPSNTILVGRNLRFAWPLYRPLQGVCTTCFFNLVLKLSVSVMCVYVYWCFTSHATIFQLYMWRHRWAGGLEKKLYLRSGSKPRRHFVGFYNMPVQAPTRGHPFYTVIPRNRPI